MGRFSPSVIARDPCGGTEGLVAAFGAEVAALVQEVTDDKTLPAAERKRLPVEYAPYLSLRARRVQRADKITSPKGVAHGAPGTSGCRWPARKDRRPLARTRPFPRWS